MSKAVTRPWNCYSQQGNLPSALITPRVVQKVFTAFCNPISFEGLLHMYRHTYNGPAPVLVPSLAAKINMVGFSHYLSYGTLLWWKKSPLCQHNRNSLHFSSNFPASLLRFSQETTVQNAYGIYKDFTMQKKALWCGQHGCVRCRSLEGTEVQQIGCFSIWQFIASSTMPATLLRPSHKQQVAGCIACVPSVSSTACCGLPDHCLKPLKAKSSEKHTNWDPPKISWHIVN